MLVDGNLWHISVRQDRSLDACQLRATPPSHLTAIYLNMCKFSQYAPFSNMEYDWIQRCEFAQFTGVNLLNLQVWNYLAHMCPNLHVHTVAVFHLTDWRTDWLTDWLVSWLADQPTNWLTDRPQDRPTQRQTDQLINLLTDWPTYRLTDQPVNWLTGSNLYPFLQHTDYYHKGYSLALDATGLTERGSGDLPEGHLICCTTYRVIPTAATNLHRIENTNPSSCWQTSPSHPQFQYGTI